MKSRAYGTFTMVSMGFFLCFCPLQFDSNHPKDTQRMVKLNHPFLNVALEWSNLQGRKKMAISWSLHYFFSNHFFSTCCFFWSWGDKRSVSKHKNKNPIRVFFSCFFQPLRDKAIFLFCFLTTALCFAFAAIMHLFKCQRFSHRRASGCINTRWSSTPHSTVVLCCLLSLWKTGISRSTTPFVSTSTCCFQCSRRVNWGSMCIYFERTLHVLLMSLLAILFLPWMTRKGPYFSPSKFDHYYVLFGTWFFNVLRVAQLNEAWFSLHNHRFFKRVFADRRSLDGPLHWYGNLLEFGEIMQSYC